MSLSKKSIGNGIYFVTPNFLESRHDVKNPGRGWYRHYTLIAGEGFPTEEWFWGLHPNESLAMLMVDLCHFRQEPLDVAALADIERAIKFFRENDKELILRFTYDSKGGGLMTEPSNIKLIEAHMDQLSEILCKNNDIIFCIQGLFIGTWGEMHSSRFVSEAALRTLWKALMAAGPKDCFYAVRKPSQWRAIDDKTGMVGLFNDGILGSPTDLGTYLEDYLEKELSFVDRLCRKVPNGGEVVSNIDPVKAKEEIDVLATLARLKKLHISYLNYGHDARLLDRWKELDYNPGKNFYNYIGMHLGYRFVVSDVKLKKPKMLSGNKIMGLDIKIDNTGFANIYEKATADLIFEDADGNPVLVQNLLYDFREIAPGESANLEVMLYELDKLKTEATKRPCNVYLKLTRKRDGRVIYFANEGVSERILIGKIV